MKSRVMEVIFTHYKTAAKSIGDCKPKKGLHINFNHLDGEEAIVKPTTLFQRESRLMHAKMVEINISNMHKDNLLMPRSGQNFHGPSQ